MFDSKQEGKAIVDTSASQGTMQSMAREATEARGMVEAAQAFPRDENAAFLALDRSCQRQAFASRCSYRFPRGGSSVTGPTVDLAREAARCWGNITYGIRIIDDDDERVHIQGWAWDMQTNARVTVEDKFRKLIQRKDKKTRETIWVKPDERDLRELINRRGALAERNAILKVLPRDLIDDARDTADGTLVQDSQGRLGKNREETVKSLVKAYDEFGVSPSMLEDRLGHPLAAIDADELSDLRQVYQSLKDGNTKRSHYFDIGDTAGAKQAADELTESVKGRATAPPEDKPKPVEVEIVQDAPAPKFIVCVACDGDGGECLICAGSGEVLEEVAP